MGLESGSRSDKFLGCKDRRRAGQAAARGILSASVISALLCGCQAPPAQEAGQPAPRAAGRFAPQGADAPLLPFLQALDHAGSQPVDILQIGDSHTANDSFSGALRERLQARFGAAGRGVLQPGVPFDWYRPQGVAVTASGFTAVPAFALPHRVCDTELRRVRGQRRKIAVKLCQSVGPSGYARGGAFGIASARQEASGPAEATLSVTDGSTIGAAEVELLGQPGGGSVQIQAPPAPPVVARSAGTGPVWVQVPVAAGATQITVRALGDGPVDWLAWRVQRGGGGVSLSNLGIPGATVSMLNLWDPAIVRAELAHLHPALIILAFGTNEGFKPSLDMAQYAADFAQHLDFLRRAAPGAALLVVGPPDGERRGAAPAAGTCRDGWNIPLYLPQVRAAIRDAAARAGAFYWDWQLAMGGPCAMTRWADAQPPLGMPDHVHMRSDGYGRTADALADTLLRAYARYTGAPAG